MFTLYNFCNSICIFPLFLLKNIAFSDGYDDSLTATVTDIDTTIDAIFWADLVMCFLSAYHDENENLVTDLK